jgi:hypothetical protein
MVCNPGIKKRERGRRRGVKTRRFSDWLKEGRKEFPLSQAEIVLQKCQWSSRKDDKMQI